MKNCIELASKIKKLKNIVEWKRKKIIDYYKMDREIQLRDVNSEFKMLEEMYKRYNNITNKRTLSLKKLELEKMRLDLVLYKDYILKEWEELDPNCRKLHKLEQKYRSIEKENTFAGIKEMHTKKNCDWIALIIDLMNEGNDKEYELAKIVNDEKKQDVFLIIKPKSFETSSINKDMLLRPFVYSKKYDNSDFILYDRMFQIDYDTYLEQPRTIYRLLGMPKEVEKKIVDLTLEEKNKIQRTKEL